MDVPRQRHVASELSEYRRAGERRIPGAAGRDSAALQLNLSQREETLWQRRFQSASMLNTFATRSTRHSIASREFPRVRCTSMPAPIPLLRKRGQYESQDVVNDTNRFEMKGFPRCDDTTLRTIRPWLRVGPAICGVWMAMGLITDSAATLWVLAPFAAFGAVLPVHPVDVPYNFVIRRWTRTPPLPSYGTPRRFSCAMASVWTSVTAWALASGAIGTAMSVVRYSWQPLRFM